MLLSARHSPLGTRMTRPVRGVTVIARLRMQASGRWRPSSDAKLRWVQQTLHTIPIFVRPIVTGCAGRLHWNVDFIAVISDWPTSGQQTTGSGGITTIQRIIARRTPTINGNRFALQQAAAMLTIQTTVTLRYCCSCIWLHTVIRFLAEERNIRLTAVVADTRNFRRLPIITRSRHQSDVFFDISPCETVIHRLISSRILNLRNLTYGLFARCSSNAMQNTVLLSANHIKTLAALSINCYQDANLQESCVILVWEKIAPLDLEVEISSFHSRSQSRHVTSRMISRRWHKPRVIDDVLRYTFSLTGELLMKASNWKSNPEDLCDANASQSPSSTVCFDLICRKFVAARSTIAR